MQMFATVTFTTHSAPPGSIAGQPQLSSFEEHAQQQQVQHHHASPVRPSQPPNNIDAAPNDTGAPSPKPEFDETLRELSHDLVLKEQQIELLISELPGLGTSEAQQMHRMQALERKLDAVEADREEAMREKRHLDQRLAEKIAGVRGL